MSIEQDVTGVGGKAYEQVVTGVGGKAYEH